MILNNFYPFASFRFFKALGLQIMVLSLFSCSKTANSNGNKAYVALTHVAYGTGPLNITLDGDSLLSEPLSFGATSGLPGNPYDTAVSRISEMQLLQGSTPVLSGNSAFQQGGHYSIFAYDTLDNTTLSMLILQDVPVQGRDTTSNFRFLNFSPSSQIGVLFIYVQDKIFHDTIHIYIRDTVNIPASKFVGYNPSPAAYPFKYYAHIGTNQVIAYVDSVKPRPDSSNWRRLGTVQFDSTKFYNIYLQGYFFPSSVQDSLQLKSIRLN
jgi:hypothetical protein